MSINLDEATKPELKAYARDELGLSLTMNMHEETMRQRIADAESVKGADAIDVSELGGEEDKTAGWVEINVQKSGEKGGGQPVFVGFNARGYTIPRGINVKVPPGVEYILRKAVKTVYETDDDTGEMVGRETPSYPYQVTGGFENRL